MPEKTKCKAVFVRMGNNTYRLRHLINARHIMVKNHVGIEAGAEITSLDLDHVILYNRSCVTREWEIVVEENTSANNMVPAKPTLRRKHHPTKTNPCPTCGFDGNYSTDE